MAGRAVVLRIKPPVASCPFQVSIPDACALRLPQKAEHVQRAGEAVLLFPSPYHGVLAVKGCACEHACGLMAVCDP